MYENFHVQLEKKINENNEIEVNNQTKRNLINNNLIGLTFYELCCKPREIKDVNKISIDIKKIDRIIKETLRCNICLQIYHEPVNMKNCLHKFCKKCIEEYNRRIKKECASCRHPIETRRLLREDNKIKEIINCLIPNIEKFNELEDQIIKNFLPQFCFKENDLINQQNQTKSDAADNFLERNPSTNNIENNIANNITPVKNNICDSKISDSDSSLLGKKKSRDKQDNITQKSDESLKFKSVDVTEKFERGIDVEVKLICDLPNEDMKKAFTKSKIYTNEHITLEYFSKYICFKQDLKYHMKDKIIFYSFDDKEDKFDLSRDMSLRTVLDLLKSKENKVRIHFNYNNLE